MLEWLTAYPSLGNPYTLTAALAVTATVALMILRKRSAFLMLLLLFAPFPKLYSIGLTVETDEIIAGSQLNNVARPGGSASELILIAGLLTLPLAPRRREWQKLSILGKIPAIWIVTVVLSAAIASLVKREAYPLSSVLHTFRYAATVACYFLGRRCLSRDHAHQDLVRLTRLLLLSGNVYIVLSILYYAFIGSTTNPNQMVADAGGGGIWRNYLLFFDYAYDFGLYAATVCVANLIAAVLSPSIKKAVWYACGALLCALATLLTGERGNLLILGTTLFVSVVVLARGASPAIANRAKRLAVGAVAVTVLVGAFQALFAPAVMTEKLAGTVRNDTGELAASLGATLGVNPAAQTLLASLPIGDYAIRLALMLGSTTYFVHHPMGIGFGAELSATGQFAHHDVVRIAVELGVAGLTVFAAVVMRLATFTRYRFPLDPQTAPLVVAIQAVTGGMLIAMCCAVTVVFLLKFSVLYWSLLGAIDGTAQLRRQPTPQRQPPAPLG